MPKATPTPQGVKRAMAATAASLPKGKAGVAKLLAAEYGVTDSQADNFLNRKRAEIDNLRGRASESLMILAVQASARLSEKLSDDEVMRETSVKDLAMTIDKTINAAVTAADGHKPAVSINFGMARELEKQLLGKVR